MICIQQKKCPGVCFSDRISGFLMRSYPLHAMEMDRHQTQSTSRGVLFGDGNGWRTMGWIIPSLSITNTHKRHGSHLISPQSRNQGPFGTFVCDDEPQENKESTQRTSFLLQEELRTIHASIDARLRVLESARKQKTYVVEQCFIHFFFLTSRYNSIIIKAPVGRQSIIIKAPVGRDATSNLPCSVDAHTHTKWQHEGALYTLTRS